MAPSSAEPPGSATAMLCVCVCVVLVDQLLDTLLHTLNLWRSLLADLGPDVKASVAHQHCGRSCGFCWSFSLSSTQVGGRCVTLCMCLLRVLLCCVQTASGPRVWHVGNKKPHDSGLKYKLSNKTVQVTVTDGGLKRFGHFNNNRKSLWYLCSGLHVCLEPLCNYRAAE